MAGEASGPVRVGDILRDVQSQIQVSLDIVDIASRLRGLIATTDDPAVKNELQRALDDLTRVGRTVVSSASSTASNVASIVRHL
ncbi:MAG: hypothetical protein FJX36_08490 [Alphaproteobacteria bacterium]|nr:hypothetical protein [Alphaproteobacteria bacterium]